MWHNRGNIKIQNQYYYNPVLNSSKKSLKFKEKFCESIKYSVNFV